MDHEQADFPQGESKEVKKNYSGGKTEGLVSLEKTRLVEVVWQKKNTPPCHAEHSRVKAEQKYTLDGRKSFPAIWYRLETFAYHPEEAQRWMF